MSKACQKMHFFSPRIIKILAKIWKNHPIFNLFSEIKHHFPAMGDIKNSQHTELTQQRIHKSGVTCLHLEYQGIGRRAEVNYTALINPSQGSSFSSHPPMSPDISNLLYGLEGPCVLLISMGVARSNLRIQSPNVLTPVADCCDQELQ